MQRLDENDVTNVEYQSNVLIKEMIDDILVKHGENSLLYDFLADVYDYDLKYDYKNDKWTFWDHKHKGKPKTKVKEWLDIYKRNLHTAFPAIGRPIFSAFINELSDEYLRNVYLEPWKGYV